MKMICQLCGTQFEARRNDAKYCSDSCRNKASRQRRGLVGKKCIICGQIFSPLTPSANKRKFCYNCIPVGETATRGKYIELIKTSRGGQCVRCGYDTCMQALEFHHLDPTKKETIISSDSITVEQAIEESKKCILLCSNCHKELHANLWKIEKINGITIRKEEEEVSFDSDE